MNIELEMCATYTFTDYKGQRWSELLVDTYNTAIRSTNTRIHYADYPKDSTEYLEYKVLRDNQRKVFESCVELAGNKNVK